MANNQYSDTVTFVEKMGNGWNVGNTFDSFDRQVKGDETQWGNPRVTKQLLKKIKDEGYTSIRIPFSVVSRQDKDNQIDPAFLNRYKQVVDWALNDGFYVITDLHADAYAWLKYWDGQESSPEYVRFTDLWEQIADKLKDENDHLILESINEPFFFNKKEQYNFLNKINLDFYHLVRASGSNNQDRYLMLPTVSCTPNQEGIAALDKTIESLHDSRIIATVHYYSQNIFGNNMGKTGFDEKLFKGKKITARRDIDDLAKRLKEGFINHGIGVVIGEWGQLAYDRGNTVLNVGESYKYIEYLGEMQRKNPGIILMLWDNGQFFNRKKLRWRNPYVGQVIHASLTTNSAYGKDYDHTFINKHSKKVAIPLVLNGNKLKSVLYSGKKLTKGKDYLLKGDSLVLLKHFVKKQKKHVGRQGTLALMFNHGAYWRQDLNYITKKIKLGKASTVVGETLVIPADLRGDIFKNASLMNKKGQPVNNNPSQDYLVAEQEIYARPAKKELALSASVTKLLTKGNKYTLTINTYNGKSLKYLISVKGKAVNGRAIK